MQQLDHHIDGQLVEQINAEGTVRHAAKPGNFRDILHPDPHRHKQADGADGRKHHDPMGDRGKQPRKNKGAAGAQAEGHDSGHCGFPGEGKLGKQTAGTDVKGRIGRIGHREADGKRIARGLSHSGCDHTEEKEQPGEDSDIFKRAMLKIGLDYLFFA